MFKSLLKDTLEDVLITGDQSLTDVLSYCPPQKNIWYQVVTWKENFAYELSRLIPNKFLSNFKTSCGTLRGIRMHKNNKKIIQNWDFRVLGKKRMDAIILSRRYLDNPIMIIFMYLFEHSRNQESFMNKFKKQIQNN